MILMVMNIIPTTMIMGHWSNGYKLRAKNLSSSVEDRAAELHMYIYAALLILRDLHSRKSCEMIQILLSTASQVF